MNTRKDLAATLAAHQERLGAAQGKQYWRTLEELAETEAFQELVQQEFPEQASLWPDSLSRRRFLTLMGASLALAGVGGCSVRPAPSVTLVPRVRAPEEMLPGLPQFYATAMTLGGSAVGLLVESHEGRPTKIEGNPDHPSSLGATDPFHQAAVLTFYDPDRSKTVTHLGQTTTWDKAVAALRSALEKQRPHKGAGLRILTETVVSPTLGRQLQELLKEFPEAKWHQYEPLTRDNAHCGTLMALGQPVSTRYDFRKADVVLSLDANFLSCQPGSIPYAADFMASRRIRVSEAEAKAGKARMNRLYVVEPSVSLTGAKADHRLPLRASQIEGFARALAGRLGVKEAGKGDAAGHEKWIAAVARDLERHRGRCLILAGERQPPVVHLLAHVLNQRLGNVGQTVLHTDPIEVRPVDQNAALRELVHDMDREKVELLLILGGNPVYNAPADFHFAEQLRKVPLRCHLSLYQDETSRLCQYHIPEAHFLESWSDTRAHDGTASIVQPLIEPLYQGRSAHELLSALTGQLTTPAYDLVRATWCKHWGDKHDKDFEQLWQTALHDGVVAGTALATRSVPLKSGWEKHLEGGSAAGASGYEIVFEADPTIHDGRFANNGWLQELPKPITKLTWDNAAIMSPATAKELNVGIGGYAHGGEHGGYHPNIVELKLGDAVVKAMVWVLPGHVDGAITVSLGYGRDSAGKVGGNSSHTLGFNAYQLRTSDHLWFASGLKVTRTWETGLLACTQQHHLMERRDPVRVATLQEFFQDPQFTHRKEKEELEAQTQRGVRLPLTMYKEWPYQEHKWGMAIDLTTCIGCSACIVACQAENNIPVVGKEQVAAGREMHWLRVDRYISGSAEEPSEFHFQPVPCQHCENAPCEYVCPVEATVHSAEGLNDMVYQRCVGTRFCSNNCPYKVRRFNFFFYADYNTETLKMQYNPDVTVRSRGVMEKCSYCVQRIRRAEIDSQVEKRSIADGEVLTACQAVCPTQAIIFGDINDRDSTVRQWKETTLNYSLLADLNTSPRTTYLGALRNPNPELEEQ